jgi:hypothetical protein
MTVFTMVWPIAVAAAVLLALLGWRLRRQPLPGTGLTGSAAQEREPLVSPPEPMFRGIDGLGLGAAPPKMANWWRRQG